MENRKVMVKSESTGRLSINLPELRLKRIWEKKGTIRPISFEDLQQALYVPGVEYMFKEGMLSIESMQDKIDLGLEPEGTKEDSPVNIIILNDSQKKRYLTVLPTSEFKQELEKLPYEQINSLVDYAIEKELMDMDKCDILKEKTGIDIIRAIQLNRQAKEE